MQNKRYISLILWIIIMIAIGMLIGYLTKPEMNTWYIILNRSTLTPPNYLFPIAWTILYGIIGACGWLIWYNDAFTQIKILYITHLILNWSWTPLFFYYHCTIMSLIVLCAMNIIVTMIIWLCYRKMRIISLLMIPYLSWLLFATYLNLYIWQYN